MDKLGPGVEAFKLGQRVGAITIYGSHADYLCVPAWWLVPVSDRLDPAEAAIVVFNYVTAYQMLHRTARVRRGERLLVHGAAGGVGTAVLQLGRVSVIRDAWRREKAGELEPAVAVRRAHHGNLDGVDRPVQ